MKMIKKLNKSKVAIISIFALITFSFFCATPRFVSGAASNSVNIDIQLIGYTNDTIEGTALCSIAGNFDNDEFLDIAVGSSNGKVYVIENSTKGFVKSWDSGNDFGSGGFCSSKGNSCAITFGWGRNYLFNFRDFICSRYQRKFSWSP